MIAIDTSRPDGPMELHISGRLTREDYTDHLVPAIETAAARDDALRVLVRFAPDFAWMDAGAMWEDFKLGLSHWSGFDRVAVVTDHGGLATAVRAFAVLMPCPVQVFALSDIDGARRWLGESLGTIHMSRVPGGLRVELMGDLDAAAYEDAEEDLNKHIRQIEPFRLLLDLRQFEGWRGLRAMMAHFSLATSHAPQAERVAVLGDAVWQHAAERIAHLFLRGETRFFRSEDEPAALDWIAG